LRGLVEQSPFSEKEHREKVLVVPASVGVPILVSYAQAEDPRWLGLYQRFYPKLPRFITRKLGSPYPTTHSVNCAITALGFYGTNAADAVAALLKLEAAKPQFVQERVITALGNIGPPASNAIPMLVTHFQSGPTVLASSATLALGKIDSRGERTGPLLVSVLNTPPIQFNALQALSLMAKNEPKWIPEIWRAAENTSSAWFFRDTVSRLHSLGALTEERVGVIASKAGHPDPNWRSAPACGTPKPTPTSRCLI
jgi:hypothetical protein